MTVYIQAKQLHKRKTRVAACRYELERKPECLRELIGMMVCDGVSDYNRRIEQSNAPQPLSAESVEAMSGIGRIGFGIPFDSRQADPEEAVRTAVAGFSDGLFRFFVGDEEIESLDVPLEIRDGDTITIIRLVMLTGGFFW